MKKSVKIAIAIGCLALLWIVSGYIVPSKGDAKNDASMEDKGKSIVQVRVRDIEVQDFSGDVILTGRSVASQKVQLRAETEGQVVDIPVIEGSFVEKDAPIVSLEKRDREASITEAQERVRQREIEYNASKALETKGYNSKIRLAQALADLESARADRERAVIDLGKINIKAPFEGIAYNKNVEVGDYLAIGDVVFDIVNLDPVHMVGFVSEKQIENVTLGVLARTVLVRGREYAGKVIYKAPAANPNTRTFEVKLLIENKNREISEGMTATIYIPMKPRKAHRISPSILSLNDAGLLGVKLLNKDNQVVFTPVNVLADREDAMWVEGLPDKARVITVGQEFVISGQNVEPVLAKGDGLL